ncbi:topology modulation protein [Bacillus sp. JCM 19041]|uniref:topology modulation protein n=1 Tax=Bacillus sp. JCM 19041 TaxID=1460637 RepID=UPI0006D2B009
MQRVMVVGISSGVGKSTFAKKLANVLDLPVHHLDTLYWKPNWVETSSEEFSFLQREVAAQESWIIEGNYNSTFGIRTERADTIIYLELPLRVCLYRVFKRWLTNIGKTRSDMASGCKEKIDYAFIKFIVTTYRPRKRKMADRLQHFLESGPDKKVIRLKGKKAIKSYIKTVDKVN